MLSNHSYFCRILSRQTDILLLKLKALNSRAYRNSLNLSTNSLDAACAEFTTSDITSLERKEVKKEKMEVLVNNEPINLDDNISNTETESYDATTDVYSSSQLEHALR